MKEEIVWAQLIEGWEAKLAGDTSDAEARFEAAKNLAATRGFRYMSAGSVAKLPVQELLARVEAVPLSHGEPDAIEAAALLGGAREPAIKVSRALELFWDLTRDRTLGKSEDQLRRWRNPRLKAVKNFLDVVGDKLIDQITGDDMLDFRAWWIDRIEAEDMTANSANKDLGHLSDVLRTVNKMKRLGLDLPLNELSIKQGEAKTRPPFSREWITDKLLEKGALDGLNEDARHILLTMVNTGCRPSEIASMGADQICLDAKVPHIRIEAVDRQLKSKNARRIIALTGVSLEAMRACPSGFPRYAQNSATLSATTNKFLRSNGLLETPKHSLYSLRHSFEDRLLAANVDERVRRDLTGPGIQVMSQVQTSQGALALWLVGGLRRTGGFARPRCRC